MQLLLTPLRGKVKTTFPLRLEIPQRARDSHFPTAATATVHPPASKLKIRISYYDLCGVGGQVSPYCIKDHTKAAIKHGSSPQEIMEAIWVVTEMRAGGAYAHSAISLTAMNDDR